MGQGKQLYWEYNILRTKDSRDMPLDDRLFFHKSDRKRAEGILLLQMTTICILGTSSLEERLHTKLFPDRKETADITATSYSKVNERQLMTHNMYSVCNSRI